MPITRRYPQYNQHLVLLGWAICLFSLVLASFATRTWHLIITQGLLYGFGWAVCYTPFIVMLNQWFVKKRGAVYGILFSSSGIVATVLPFGLEAGLQRFGFRTTLRMTAGIFLVVTAPGMFLIRPRIKVSGPCPEETTKKTPYIKKPVFILFSLAVFFQGLSWFLPRFFLPSFAHDLSLSHTQGATLLALFGLAQTTGQITLGWVSDKVNIYVPVTLSLTASTLAVFIWWGPAKGMIRLSGFSLLYGSFGGGYTVLWARIGLYCTKDEKSVIAIYTIFSVMRGLGNVFSGPLSSMLLLDDIEVAQYGLEKYKRVIILVGTGMALSLACCVGYFFGEEANDIEVSEKLPGDSPMSNAFLLSDQDGRRDSEESEQE